MPSGTVIDKPTKPEEPSTTFKKEVLNSKPVQPSGAVDDKATMSSPVPKLSTVIVTVTGVPIIASTVLDSTERSIQYS